MKVYNKRDRAIPPDAIYVGRPTKWGNLYVIGKDGTREEVISQYRGWLSKRVASGELNLDDLRGKDLICWCAPLPCHADILMEVANAV